MTDARSNRGRQDRRKSDGQVWGCRSDADNWSGCGQDGRCLRSHSQSSSYTKSAKDKTFKWIGGKKIPPRKCPTPLVEVGRTARNAKEEGAAVASAAAELFASVLARPSLPFKAGHTSLDAGSKYTVVMVKRVCVVV